MTEFEKRIQYTFKNPQYLKEAVTHSSYAHEHKGCPNYERLEFLGDAVLETVVSNYLFQKFPADDEGLLTRKRASLVCEDYLSGRAEQLCLGKKVRLGRGMPEEYRNNKSLLCDIIEALIGAIYLDGGMDAAQRFIYENILVSADEITIKDSKTELQENFPAAQIEYKTTEQAEGFISEVKVDGCLLGTGIGHNKKEAEKQAAAEAIIHINDN